MIANFTVKASHFATSPEVRQTLPKHTDMPTSSRRTNTWYSLFAAQFGSAAKKLNISSHPKPAHECRKYCYDFVLVGTNLEYQNLWLF